MSAMQFRPFHDWKRQLLHRRGLAHPDGRDLYRYRLSEDEFNTLENLLRNWIGKLTARANLDVIAARLTGFRGLFVLYAAEWWRRRYDGSHWSWEPIVRAIGADPDEWTQTQRSDCIRLGLQEWGLAVRATGGLRYLGSIAIQGGLPLHLLAQARGGIGQVLGRVLQLAGTTRATPADLLAWIESLQGSLPKSYRHAAIYTLLTDVAWTVLNLKEEAHLAAGADAISQLDQKLGRHWRERFPLPVEDRHAQGLIEQLIEDAVRVRIERQQIRLRRSIQRDGIGGWLLKSSLELPDSIAAKQLATLFGINVEELPRMAELRLEAGGQYQSSQLRRLAGQDVYRGERRPWGFAGWHAAREHVFRLHVPDGRVWSASVGAEMDEYLPWVFSTDDGCLLRQGGGGISASEVWLALPEDWQTTGQAHGCLTEPKRQVWHICGDIPVHSPNGDSFRIRTSQAGAQEHVYEWRGERCWLEFLQPGAAFKGLPNLYLVDQDGIPKPVSGQLAWSTTTGPTTVRYPASGDIKHRARLLILPRDAELNLVFRDNRAGEICFANWQLTGAKVLTPGVRSQLRHQGGNQILEVATDGNARTPERLEIELHWHTSTQSARLAVPFPALGARAFAGDGRELKPGALLAAHLMTGVRIQVLPGQQNSRVTLELELGDIRRVHAIRPSAGMLGMEVRLQDYAAEIQHLLSANDAYDARVAAVIRIGGRMCLRLVLARYAARLVKEDGHIRLDDLEQADVATLARLPVLALRLERPGDEALPLAGNTSEGVATGSWAFLPAQREPGSWLIYPGANSDIPFRPTLWPVAGQVTTDSPLALAIGIGEDQARIERLDQVISALAANYQESCWSDLERLAWQIGHLPLATLDLWRRFVRNPRGMVALALRFGSLPQGFLERFEQELPFAWETVSVSVWRQGMECLQRQCQGVFGETGGGTVFQSHLEKRCQVLSADHGALAFSLGIVSAEYLSSARRDSQGLVFLGRQADQQLFQAHDSLSMRLRQRHAEEQWPTGLNPILTAARSQAGVAEMLHPQSLGYPDGAINLPLLLATQAATNQTDDWFAHPEYIHVLRAHRAFDPDWFDEAYNLTIARCLAKGLLTV